MHPVGWPWGLRVLTTVTRPASLSSQYPKWQGTLRPAIPPPQRVSRDTHTFKFYCPQKVTYNTVPVSYLCKWLKRVF